MLITDPDEEIFLLYSAVSSTSRGLGYVDNRKSTLEINFDLKRVVERKKGKPKTEEDSISIEILQDQSSLRSRKGDTGSVLWKASIDFAQLVLQQSYCNASDSLLPNAETLKSQHILELGSGVGLLSIALSSLVRRYTVTDINALVPLIKRNLLHNYPQWPNIPATRPGGNIIVEELDWQLLESSTPAQRSKTYDIEPIDILLAVDCIYHPSLIPPLVTTIDFLSTPNHTSVIIVSELRSEDVLREFLEAWLSTPNWEIRRVTTELENYYVVWSGKKVVEMPM